MSGAPLLRNYFAGFRGFAIAVGVTTVQLFPVLAGQQLLLPPPAPATERGTASTASARDDLLNQAVEILDRIRKGEQGTTPIDQVRKELELASVGSRQQ